MNQAYAIQPQPLPGAVRTSAWVSLRRAAEGYLLEITVLVAMILRFVPEPYNISSFLILAIVAFMGRRGTIMALAGGWFAYAANPGFADEAPLGAAIRWLVILAAVVAALFRVARQNAGDRVSAPTAATAAIAALLLIHSALFSLFPSLSIFKSVLWGSVALAIVSTVRGMTEEDFARLQRFMLVFMGVILIASLAVMPFPEARLRNDVGLQGVLNHPQLFGVFCALAGTYYFGTALASPRPSWLALGMVLLSLQGVIESAARTGGFALVLGCLGLVAVTAVRSTAFFRRTLPGVFSGRFAALAVVALVAGLVNSEAVRQTADQFVSKNTRAQEATVAYDASRGWMIQDMRENIENRPAEGIGLGIQSATHLIDIEVDEVTGLPISAPVEKGVMWIALFEELGLMLGALVLGWILWGTARAIHVGAAAGAASIGYFFTNFAEATFFSPGASGMLGLIFFFMGMAKGDKKQPPSPVPAVPMAAPAWPHRAA